MSSAGPVSSRNEPAKKCATPASSVVAGCNR